MGIALLLWPGTQSLQLYVLHAFLKVEKCDIRLPSMQKETKVMRAVMIHAFIRSRLTVQHPQVQTFGSESNREKCIHMKADDVLY